MSADEDVKARMRATFDRLAPDFDSAGCFAYFGRRLVEEAGIEPGLSVLDVASGTGAVLFPAAERVGPTGSGMGIDLSEEMARVANAEASRRGLAARVRVMDAERLEYADAEFDRVLCGFGLLFFPHLARAMTEIRRVLRSGGRIGVSTWRTMPTSDLAAILNEAHPTGEVEPRWIDEPIELAGLLEQSGFSDVRAAVDAHVFRFPDLGAYWRNAVGTRIRRRLDALTPEQVERVRDALGERLAPRRRPDGLYVEASAVLAVGAR